MILVSVIIPIGAFARLGETEAECTKRYGKPVNAPYSTNLMQRLNDRAHGGTYLSTLRIDGFLSGASNVVYEYDGWRIRVGFLDGKAERIEYQKIAEKGGSWSINDEEIDAILVAEGGGSRSNYVSKIGDVWIDGGRRGEYSIPHGEWFEAPLADSYDKKFKKTLYHKNNKHDVYIDTNKIGLDTPKARKHLSKYLPKLREKAKQSRQKDIPKF